MQTNLLVNTFPNFLSSYIKLTQVLIINYVIIIKSINTVIVTGISGSSPDVDRRFSFEP